MSGVGDGISTFCRICEARCGIDVTVTDGRVTRIAPDKSNPYSWRDFCTKGRTAHELLEHPRRLRAPLRRDGDRYVEASWEEAIADIAARLTAIRDAYGAEAIAAYTGNPIGFNGANGLFFLPLMRAIGSRNVFGVGSVDQNNLHRVCFEMYGRWLVPLIPDVDACTYFLLVGMDPAVSTFGWIHNVPDGWRRAQACQAAGGTIVVVDPARTSSAAAADHHLAIWPGQDWALLLAILAIVLCEGLERPVAAPPLDGLDALRALVEDVDLAALAERCQVPVGVIAHIARGFASAPTAMCVCHTGVSHGGAGAVAEWLSHVLNAVTGRLDVPGGRRFERGYLPIGAISGTRAGTPSRVRGLPAIAGFRSLAELADEMSTPGDGQVRALLCNSGNPVVSGPQGARLGAALAQLDLLVAVDLVQRESHRHADWMLPAAHWLERDDLLTIYAHFEDRPFVQLGRAAVAPPAGVREEWRIWVALADAMGLELFGGPASEAPTPGDLQRALVEQGGRVTWEQLESNLHGVVYGNPEFGHLHEAIATSDGAVRLAPEPFLAAVRRLLATPAAAPPPQHPLVLSNRRRKASMNSWLNDLPSARKAGEANVLEIHPDDAHDLGVTTGDLATVESAVGRIELGVVVSDRPRRGVVITEHGWGSAVCDPHDGGDAEVLGANRNLLSADACIDELSATPAFSTTYVRVERAG